MDGNVLRGKRHTAETRRDARQRNTRMIDAREVVGVNVEQRSFKAHSWRCDFNSVETVITT